MRKLKKITNKNNFSDVTDNYGILNIMNKKIILIVLIVLMILIFLLTLLLQKPDNYILKSKTFGQLSYSGNVLKGKPNGEVTVKSDNQSFYLKGTFDNGIFKNGLVMITQEKEKFYMEGSFNDLLLQDGKIIITTDTEKIEKSGTFVNNKLTGIGSIKITDLKTSALKFTYSGKFENDKPIYK